MHECKIWGGLFSCGLEVDFQDEDKNMISVTERNE